ncbi:MAG: AsmA-like C-terminal region-containing protein [Pseudomonadota bacterium]
MTTEQRDIEAADGSTGLRLRPARHALAPPAWWLVVFLLLLLAFYVSVGRVLMTQVEYNRDSILSQLNARLPFDVQAGSVAGRWDAFSPVISFRDVSISSGQPGALPVFLDYGELKLNVLSSLLKRRPQLSRLEFSGLELDAELTDQGKLVFAGIQGTGGNGLQVWMEDFLPNVEVLSLTEHRLRLRAPNETLFPLQLDLRFTRRGNTRVLSGVASNDDLRVVIEAGGVGNPLRPDTWTGDVFLDIDSDRLAQLDFLWSSLRWPFTLTGSANAQFWLTRASGDSNAKLSLRGIALGVDEKSGAWSLPVDALSFEAALVQQENHWKLLTEDFHVERGAQSLDLDRAQFDWWEKTLRVRATGLGLDALPTLLAAAPGLPEGLRAALPQLEPQGLLDTVELRIDDLTEPATTWSVRSRVSDLSVSSWRNSPAFSGISGFMQVDHLQGRVLLDSESFSMSFPSVYEQPLSYSSALGALNLSWDAAGLQLDTGLLELSGIEGDALGKLKLYVPFERTILGPELELMVTISDTAIANGSRYLPYKLPASLLTWLDTSVKDGHIKDASFIWRGSTKPGNGAHASTQLVLDVDDGVLQYATEWPVLTQLETLVMLDNSVAWATARRGTSDALTLERVALRIANENDVPTLRVAGAFHGDAQATETLLRSTPLNKVTGGVFANWTFSGSTNGSLSLIQPLADPIPVPSVALSVDLDEVDVFMDQPELSVQELKGVLNYSSDLGFASSAAQATLLGGELSLTAPPTSDGSIELNLRGGVAASAVSKWLELPILEFAKGEITFTGSLVAAGDEEGGSGEGGGKREGTWEGGERAHLTLESDLTTVELDAPRPFGKSASMALPMKIDLPLKESADIALSLGERFRMVVQQSPLGMSRLVAAVGGSIPELDSCDQRYCLSGRISTLDLLAWERFALKYAFADEQMDASVRANGVKVSEADGSTETRIRQSGSSNGNSSDQPFSYRIDSLRVGELHLGEQNFGPARVDLWGVDTLWQGALESSIAQGSLTREDDSLQLLIEYLDLDKFSSDGEPLRLAQVRELVPAMSVEVLELRKGATQLGSLGFQLDTKRSDGSIVASDVSGELFGLTLDAPEGGTLRWYESQVEMPPQSPATEFTQIEFDTSFANLGTVFEALGFEPNLESERGRAKLELSWPGSPTDFSGARLDGSIELTARNGRILESRPGALGLVSVLNLAEILRGLSLSHMFESGIPFLTASSQVFFHAGMVEIADLQIDGAASAFAFNGLSNLNAQSIDGELVVTLPVANNLPWVAALAGGLPVAAGVFVVSKVFEKQVNRMSSAVYGVSGDISSPEVQFRRLFDDRLKPKKLTPEGTGTGDD